MSDHQSRYTEYIYTDYTYVECMGSRTISLSEDAYHALLSLKRPGESFSDTVRRLARRRSLTELAQIMDPQAAKEVADAIEANRREHLENRRRRLGLP